MKEAIIEKLNNGLGQEIVSERQVVYILVEIRKLLEQQKCLNAFESLKLCCDWAVHPWLDRQSAQVILGLFDAYEDEHRRSGITVKEFNEQLNEFLSHKRFQDQLISSLGQFGIAVDAFADDHFWSTFIFHYTLVIQDSPLKAREGNTAFVSQVSAEAWPAHIAESIYPGKSVVEWTWSMKDRGYPKSVCSFF
jgi:hypothetical protein